MEKSPQSIGTGKEQLISKFYYSLALLQSKAINYVAVGENVDEKLDRITEIVKIVEDASIKIHFENECSQTPEILGCDPPCYVDKNLCMCRCEHEVSPN